MIIAGDLDSAELRIVAYRAQDKAWLDAFATGSKPHKQTVIDLFDKPYDSSSPQYKFAKSFTYQYLYCLPDKIPTESGKLRLYTVGITADRLVELTRRMDRKHPAIVRWKRETISALHRTSLCRNIFGRYRDLSWGVFTGAKDVVEHVEQAALNWDIQTVIGKSINRSFLALDKAVDVLRADGFEGYPMLQCHDELVMVTPNKHEVDTCAKLLKEYIELPLPELGGMVIPAEIKVGPNWGNKELYHV